MARVVLVTGTRKGIGRHLVDHFLERDDIVVGCSRGPFDEPLPARYEHHCLDVADEDAVVQMISTVKERHGKIDVLVNNAGIASMNHCLLTPMATVRNVFSTNVFGTVLFAREVAKLMVTAKFGRIVNMATVATPLRLEGESAYAASKAAVESYTRVLANELASFGITVNAVGSTPILTDLIRSVPEEKMNRLLRRQAIHRLGEYRDIANVIDFFASDDSDFVTGQVLYLGGVS